MKKYIFIATIGTLLCGCSTIRSLWNDDQKILQDQIRNEGTGFMGHSSPVTIDTSSQPSSTPSSTDTSQQSQTPSEPKTPPETTPDHEPILPSIPEMPIEIDLGGQSHASHSHS